MVRKGCCNSGSNIPSVDGSELEVRAVPQGTPLQQIVQSTVGTVVIDSPTCGLPQPITNCCDTTIVDPCSPSSCQPINTPRVAVLQRTCQRCGGFSGSCGCGGGQPAGCCTPPVNVSCKPFYQQVSMCPEDNRRTVIIEKISQVFRNKNAFCMPSCGARVSVTFDGVSDVAIGAWMWSFGIGYLEVVSFNANSCEIQLTNPCQTDCGTQVPAGTPIPACSLFVVTPPVCSGGGSGGVQPCLDSGFVAPVSGSCVQIAVTNVNGLSVNKNVSINTGIYRISAINSAVVITICNDGEGLTPGTVVDPGTNCAVPIILVDNNPCLNAEVLCGAMLGCNAGVTSPVVGTEIGQILVYAGNGNSCFRTLGIPVLNCTPLTVCLTLDPDLPDGTTYLVQVEDTSAFAVNDVVTIGGTEFTVTAIISSTQMRLLPLVEPSTVQTFPAGANVCSADCCTILDNRLTIIEKYVIDNQVPDCPFDGLVWLDAEANQADATPITDPTNSNAGAPNVIGNTVSVTIENNSCKNQMGVHFTVDYLWEFRTIAGSVGDAHEVELIGQYNFDVANAPTPPILVDVYHGFDTLIYGAVTGSTGFCRYFRAASTSGYIPIPVFNSAILSARTNFNFGHGALTTIQVNQLGTRVSYMAVAVEV